MRSTTTILGAGRGVFVLLLVLSACSEARTEKWSDSLASFEVIVTGGEVGKPDALLPYSDKGLALTMDIEARDAASGDALFPFTGWVRVSSRPGKVTLKGEGVNDKDVHIVDGAARNISVTIKGAFGLTRIWVEDLGYSMKAPGTVSACTDGADNDGDGMTDSEDPGCLNALDDSEEGGRYAAGVSDPIWVENLTIDQVQSHKTDSAFQGEIVLVDKGEMVVTRVTTDGMYVTDISSPDPGGPFKSVFAFNFNTPAHMRVCDRLTTLAGTVSEFYGFTEINFPSWNQIYWYPPPKGPECPVPEPRVLSASDTGTLATMEGWEAGLVRVLDVTVSRTPESCDKNGDGMVDYKLPEEDACQLACDADPLCTEALAYAAHGQFSVGLGNPPSGKVLLLTRETVPGYDPFAPNHPAKLKSVTGTLKHWKGGPRNLWIVEPRCPDDLVVESDPLPANKACVFPRTGEEEDEM